MDTLLSLGPYLQKDIDTPMSLSQKRSFVRRPGCTITRANYNLSVTRANYNLSVIYPLSVKLLKGRLVLHHAYVYHTALHTP